MKAFCKLAIVCASTQTRCLPNFLLWLAIWSTMACETVVEVDIPKESSKLVVNAFIGTDVPTRVQLTASKSILDNSAIRYISGAEVVLLEEGIPVATLEEVAESNQVPIDWEGYYASPFIPVADKHYTLQVTKSGYEPVEAQTYIPPAVPIQKVTYDTTVSTYTYQEEDSVITRSEINFNEIQLTFTDPASEKNYYELQVLQYFMYYIYLLDDQGNVVVDNQGNNVIADTVQSVNAVSLTSSDPLLAGNEDIFDGGEVSAYGTAFVFSDDFLNGKTYTLKFNIGNTYYSYNNDEDSNMAISLHTINEEQYQYAVSRELQYENEGNPFAEPVQVYNNIENGYGIFVGYSSDQVTLDF